MKINRSILSIPPYISTTWDNVYALHLENRSLIVILRSGEKITIPALSQDIIDQIFEIHAEYAEMIKIKQQAASREPLFSPKKMGPFNIDGMMRMLQHVPEQSDLAPLSPEIAQKIAMLAKIIPEEDLLAMPLSQPGCNCMYCQIHRILLKQVYHERPGQAEIAHGDEKVADSELQFQEWDIKQIKEKLYTVTSKIDPTEQYTVFLGDPLGCTCGHTNCEHIIAVLRS